MKITVKKEVVSEQVEVKPGTYYFSDESLIYYKAVVSEKDKNGMSLFRLEYTKSFANVYGITVREDELYEGDDIDYSFKQFYLDIAGQKIEKEEFEEEKQDIIKRLNG